MDQETNRIKQHIESERNRLGENLEAIETRLRDSTDLRVQFRKSPWLFSCAAFTGGVLLGALAGGRDRVRQLQTYQGGVHPLSPETTTRTSIRTSRQFHRLSGRFDTIFGALIGVATNKIQDLVSRNIPGFRDEYEKAAHRGREQVRGI